MIDDAMLLAYLDGELGPPERARVEEALAADPALAERLAAHRRLKERLNAAFAPLLEAPVPASIAVAPRHAPEVVSLDAARARLRPKAPNRWWKQATAVAASLAAGLVAGLTLSGGPTTALALNADGTLAPGQLADALGTQLASDPAGPVRVQLSFRNRAGEVCRTFSWAATSGFACRSGEGWALQGLTRQAAASEGAYRTAAGLDPNLMRLVEDAMAGDPFTAEQERSARSAGWRSTAR